MPNGNNGEIDENSLPLEEFVKLPTTVDFNALNSDRFQQFVAERPYLRLGTELANRYVVVYTNESNIRPTFAELGLSFLNFYPRIMSPLDSQANEASGITEILNQPYLNLSGRNVVIGFVDTGIDYTKDAFKFEDGSTKILSIWDQTVEGGNKERGVYFGSTYSQQQINEALRSDNPSAIVPSTDNDGHGTFLASVAASNESGEYIGAAPKAYIVAVKLKRARQYYIDRFLLPPDNPNLYESTDFLLGVKYVIDVAEELNMPIVVCIGMGSHFSGHDGNTYFEDYISFFSQRPGYAFVTAAGNESNQQHHTQGVISRTGGTDSISIEVQDVPASFSVLIVASPYDKISAGIISPTGEVIARIPFRVGLEYEERLVFERTSVRIIYYRDVNSIIMFEIKDATPGIWDITLFGDSILNGEYHAWMPITGQIPPNVRFMRPIPEYTIVYPSNGIRSISVGAYNTADSTLFVASSWGPTRLPRVAPDFVAPGVNVRGIYPTGYGTMTGTSVSAAVAAGAAAILFEWGIVQRNLPGMNGDALRTLLISGCLREPGVEYPNVKWGYGRLNLMGTFSAIKESVFDYSVSGSGAGSGSGSQNFTEG